MKFSIVLNSSWPPNSNLPSAYSRASVAAEAEAVSLDICFILARESIDQTNNERCLLLAVGAVAKYPSHPFLISSNFPLVCH